MTPDMFRGLDKALLIVAAVILAVGLAVSAAIMWVFG